MMAGKDIFSASNGCKVTALIGLFYIGLSVVLAFFPDAILSSFDWGSATGLYAAAILDLIFGIVFIWAAPSSRFPVGFNVVGAMLLLGAAFYFLMPVDIWVRYISWWLDDQIMLTRILSGLFGLPIGIIVMFGAIAPSDDGVEEST